MGWDFQVGLEADNPIFYLNALGLAAAVVLVVWMASRRDDSRAAKALWAASLVFLVGTGLHFLGDLTNFPEDWDHVLIHAVVLVALATALAVARRDEA